MRSRSERDGGQCRTTVAVRRTVKTTAVVAKMAEEDVGCENDGGGHGEDDDGGRWCGSERMVRE